MSEVGGRKGRISDIRYQISDIRGRRAEGGKDGYQISEIRDRKSEGEGWRGAWARIARVPSRPVHHRFKTSAAFLHDCRAMKSFPRFRVSRTGHFKKLRTGDASPLPVPLASGSGPGGPPFRNILKQRRPPDSHSVKAS